jgi:hypothetical protein
MLLRDLKTYINVASDHQEIGIILYSIKTGCEVATTFDIMVNISEYGELMISIAV